MKIDVNLLFIAFHLHNLLRKQTKQYTTNNGKPEWQKTSNLMR